MQETTQVTTSKSLTEVSHSSLEDIFHTLVTDGYADISIHRDDESGTYNVNAYKYS